MPNSPLLARLDQACMSQPRSKTDLSYDPPLKRIARLEARVPIYMAQSRQALQERIAASRAEQLARVARMEADRRADGPKPGDSDLGPLVRRRRGEIAKEDRADIDSDARYKPTVVGARRADPLWSLLGIRDTRRPHSGANTDDARRWIAAQTYRNALEIAGGARIGEKSMEKVDRSVEMYGPNDLQLNCTRLVADANSALGANYPVLRWVVEEYSELDEFCVVAQVDLATARVQLMAALDALVASFETYQGPAAG